MDALAALSKAAASLLAASRESGNQQTEAVAVGVVTALGLINVTTGWGKARYLRRVAEILFELAVAAEPPRGGPLS
jgi:hypothetical protein